MLTPHALLEQQLAHAFRELTRSLDGVTSAAAAAGASPTWPPSRFGVGLDGSIAGIVRHLAVWKHVLAGGLEAGAFPDPQSVAVPAGWPALLDCLRSGHERLSRALQQLPSAALERDVGLEGETLPVYSLFTLAADHDHYHAGQINLLRQQQEQEAG